MKVVLNRTLSSGISRRINALKNALNSRFFERENVVEGIVYAMLCRQHALLFGTHGTAKSGLCSALWEGTAGEVYELQFTRQTTEEFIYGPPNIKKMQEQGIIEHNVDGYLPTASFAFLEEFFDANEGLLRSLLTLLNERRFLRGHQRLDCPLHSAVATSNFRKEDDGLDAVVDRFLVQISIHPLEEEASVLKMLGVGAQPVPVPEITLAEWKQAHREISALRVSEEVVKQYLELLNTLAKERGGKHLSDRRKVWCLQLARASAWLRDSRVVEAADLAAVKYGAIIVGDSGDEVAWAKASEQITQAAKADAEAAATIKLLEGVQAKLEKSKKPSETLEIVRAARARLIGLPTAQCSVEVRSKVMLMDITFANMEAEAEELAGKGKGNPEVPVPPGASPGAKSFTVPAGFVPLSPEDEKERKEAAAKLASKIKSALVARRHSK